MMIVNNIVSYLDELIPNPVCELNYSKDYELLIAVMLSAQTTDKRVNMVTSVLFDKYPTLEALRDAKTEDVIEIIKPIGTYRRKTLNIKTIASKLLSEKGGRVPNDREFLESLNGVGRKTANVVLSILHGVLCIAVDTHVKRVSIRLGLADPNDNELIIEKKLMSKIPKDKLDVMHHQLLLFGRYYCKAKNPECNTCKLQNICKEKKKD